MKNDYRLLLTAMLDEAKSKKIINQQLANIKKNIQKQAPIDLRIKVNEKAAQQQTTKLWDSLKKTILDQKITIKVDSKEIGKVLDQIDKALANNSTIKKYDPTMSEKDIPSSTSNSKNKFIEESKDYLSTLNDVEKKVKKGEKTWSEYYDELNYNEKWVATWGESTEGQIRTSKDFEEAYNAAHKLNGGLDQMSLGAKAGEIALKGLSLAGNMLASWAITAVIQLVVTAFDNFIHRVEIAKKALSDSKSNFDSIKSEFTDLNTELESNAKRIKELESLPHPSYIDEEELKRLKESTKELERQKAAKDVELKHSSEDLSKANMKAFNKEYGDDNFSFEDVEALEAEHGDLSISPGSADSLSEKGIEGLSAALMKIEKAKAEAMNSGDTEWLDSLIERENHYKEQLENNLPVLQDYRNNLTDLMDYRELTADEQAFYDNLEQGMKLIYQFTDPSTWNQIEFDDILNTDDLDVTKDELILMAKAGELTPETLEGYTNLNNAIKESQFILEDGKSATSEFLEELYALADATDIQPENIISKTIEQLNSQYSPAFDAIGKAYQDIFILDENGEETFSLENINLEMLDSIKKGFEEINEAGASIDVSSYENLISVLSDSESTADEVHDAFNEISSSITEGLSDVSTANYDVVAASLEAMGVTNSQIVTFGALLNNTKALEEAGFDLAGASEEAMEAFVNENVSAEYAGQALDLLKLKKIYCTDAVLRTDEDINNVLSLANAVGISSEAIGELASAKQYYDDAIEGGNTRLIAIAAKRLDDVNKKIQEELAGFSIGANFNSNPVANSKETLKNDSKEAGSAAGKEAGDAYLTAFEEKYKKLKDIRDRDKISQKQYLDALRAMNERYFKGRDKYIDEYNKYQKEYLDGMLDLYKSVISGVVKQIDKHIKSLNDQKDSAVDSLKSQQESAKKALEAQKDAIEDQIKLIDKQIDSKQAQIDAINEENEARENAINLEKEQYELERLRNQRTEFVYSGKEKGFIYQTDSGAIRDQEQAVKEAEDQIRIANIEKEISLLEKKKEVLEEQQSAIDDQIEQVDAYYEELISNTESYWDTQIKGAEDFKSRWEELQDLKEQLELNVQLISMGISPDDISQLTSEELFEKVKEHYLGILADISSGNSQMLSSLSDLAGVDVSDLPSFLEETHGYMEKLSDGIDFANLNDSLSTVIDQFENVAAAAGMMTGSVIGSTGVSVGTDKSTSSSPGGSASGNVSFIDAVKSLEDESVPMPNNVADAFAGEESSDNQSIAGSVNKAKEAIAGSSSGKKKSSEGQEGSGEDSGSLLEAMSAQSKAALDEETGIPAQIQKWQELNGVLSNILENLRNIAAVIPTLNSDTNISAPGASAAGLAAAKGGVSNGARNVLVSEYNQLETIIHKNGTYEITSSPTLTDLRPGDQVLNNSQTLSLIRKKNRAAANRSNGLFIGNSLSPLPELQLRNTVLDHSFASPTAPQFLSNDNRNSLVNVSIGDVILENVQNADALSRQIVMRLPTQIKQELSKRG